MMGLIIPIVLIAAAVGLFGTFTNATFQESKTLAAKVASYDDALNKAQELRARREELLSQYNTFSVENRQRLMRGLPDNVDNIRLIIDINNIAARHQLTLKDVELGDVSDSRAGRSELAVGQSGDTVGSVQVSFIVSATYPDFLRFLQDLEHSLRLVDIEGIRFGDTAPDPGAQGRGDYTVTIRTYWLR